MSLTRAKVLRGPAKIQYKNLWFWTPDDITLTLDDGAENKVSSMYGVVDRMVINPKVNVNFTPHAVVANTTLQTMLQTFVPSVYTKGVYGSSYIGGTGTEDKLTIWSSSKEQVVLQNAVISKPPTLNFSANKPLFGAVAVTGITATTGEAPNTDIWLGVNNSLYAITENVDDPGGVFVGLPTFLQQRYKGVWGTQAGFTELWAEDGWTVDFNPSWRERKVQGLTIDYELGAIEIMAKCVPMGPTMKQLLDLIGIGGTTGASWGQGKLLRDQQTANSLVLSDPNNNAVFTLNKPIIRSPNLRFGWENLRMGEITWVSQLRINAGVQDDLASF